MSSITHIVDSTHEMGADQVLNHYEYDAWGNMTVCEETVGNRFRFNGQQYDPITRQYYLRARFYNPVMARFTQEDTYRGDGLNLYAYCANNPVYYEDPSGHAPKCVKEAYDKIKKENPGISEEEAWKRACQDAQQTKYLENILEKPVWIWSDEEIQRAVDSVHSSVYNKDNGKYPGKGGGNPFSLLISPEGKVVLASNNQYPTGSEVMMTKIFGAGNYDLAEGTTRTNYTIPEGVRLNEKENLNHAEARAIEKMKAIGGTVEGSKEACSHLSCKSCAEKMAIEKVYQITPTVPAEREGKRGQYKRDYVEGLW